MPNEQFSELAQLSGNIAVAELSYFCGYIRKQKINKEMRTANNQIPVSSKALNVKNCPVHFSF